MFSSKKTEDVVVDVQLEDLNIPEPPKEEEVVGARNQSQSQNNRIIIEETAQVKMVMPEPKAQPKKEKPFLK